MTTPVTSEGHPPTVQVGRANPEGAKYRALWNLEAYRAFSPGEQTVPLLLEHMPLTAESHVLDLGCGTGRGGALLFQSVGCRVTFLDFVGHCLDESVKALIAVNPDKLAFSQVDLETRLPIQAAFGLCADVLEHIPPESVERVLNHVLLAANHVWFQISTTDDACGALIGAPLHLSIHGHAWWRAQFEKRHCTIHFEQERPGASIFYVSAWCTAEDVMAHGRVNIDVETKHRQTAENLAHGWPTVQPCAVQDDTEVMLVGGGWSLPSQLDTIRRLRAQGAKLVTLNNAYHWCLAQGLTPSATIVMDGRAFNARFTHPVVDHCKYLICSQVHPSVLEGLPPDRTWLWHDADEATRTQLAAHYGEGQFFVVPGGSTVFLRALPLLRMLGFHRFHVFGVDSCCAPETRAHHAYAQPENDHRILLPVTVNNGRVFHCQPWMVSQAREFEGLLTQMGELFELEVYGDGLLKQMLETLAAPPAA